MLALVYVLSISIVVITSHPLHLGLGLAPVRLTDFPCSSAAPQSCRGIGTSWSLAVSSWATNNNDNNHNNNNNTDGKHDDNYKHTNNKPQT